MRIKICSALIIRVERGFFRNLNKVGNMIMERLKMFHVIFCDEIGIKSKNKDFGLMQFPMRNTRVAFFIQKEDLNQWKTW